MNDRIHDPDETLDSIIAEIGEEDLSSQTVSSSAQRVWSRLQQASAQGRGEETEPFSIRDCSDVQGLIPVYLERELSDGKRLLMEDHLRECVACRRKLRMIRDGVEGPIPLSVKPTRGSGWIWATGAIAAVILAALILQFGLWEQFIPAPAGHRATVESVDGTLFRVTPQGYRPIAAGEELGESQEVRTAKNSRAVLRLRDGSAVELGERVQLGVSEGGWSRTLRLAQGNIIVDAAPQGRGRLRVVTPDCQIAVKGTVFAVNRGTKGSRVLVIEGQVAVNQGRKEQLLGAGQQMATHQSLQRVSPERELSWSRDAEKHLALLRELSLLEGQLQTALRPGLHSSTSLLDLLPEQTVVLVSLPNLSASLGEAHGLFQARLAESPVLQEWWNQYGAEIQPHIDDLVRRLGSFGDNLGDEVAISLDLEEEGGIRPPLLLAEVTDSNAFSLVLESEVERINGEIGEDLLVIVSDPLSAAGQGGDSLYLWLAGDIFAASPSLERLADLAAILDSGAGSLAGTAFHQRLAAAYSEGVAYLVGVDVARLVQWEIDTSPAALAEGRALRRLIDFEHLLLERRPVGELYENRAQLSFSESGSGISAWLAEPAPMGTLDFISAEARAVGAFVIDNPEVVVDDVFEILRSSDSEAWQRLVEFQVEKGIDFRNDVAAPLGGEFAVALDGPVIPTPAWKAIVEVYDPSRLQRTLEWAITEFNNHVTEAGDSGRLELSAQHVGNRTFYSIASNLAETEIHYVFVDGYLIATPGRALLLDTINFRETGYTLPSSERFRELLPQNGEVNFSAFAYQDLESVLQPLAERLEGLAGEAGQGEELTRMMSEIRPNLIYAYGGRNQITLAGTDDRLVGFNLARLLAQSALLEETLRQEGKDGN